MNPESFKELRTILIELYDTIDKIKLVAKDADIDLARLTLTSTTVIACDSVLREAEKSNKIDALLEVVNGNYATNQQFRNFYDAYRKSDHDQNNDSSHRFLNQNEAWGRLRHAVTEGALTVLDAPPGYGKTAFLKEIEQEIERLYSGPNWHFAYIPLEKAYSKIDIVEYTYQFVYQEILPNTADLESAVQRLVFKLPPHQAIALVFDDIHCLPATTIRWVQQDFAPMLYNELTKLSQKFLLVFAGRKIYEKYSEGWQNPSKLPKVQRIGLLKFEKDTIRNRVLATSNRELKNRLGSPEYQEWLIRRLIEFCGGHPQTFSQLLEEIEKGHWQPLAGLSKNNDKEFLIKHVVKALERLLEGLDDTYKHFVQGLSIFRSADTNTIMLIQQRLIKMNDGYRTIIRTLQRENVVDTRYRLDPLIRHGLSAYMANTNPSYYEELNRKAQEAYQDLITDYLDKDQPAEFIEKNVGECIYHCLCRITEQHEIPKLSKCIHDNRLVLELLLKRDQDTYRTSRVILTNIMIEDEDIQMRLKDLKTPAEQLLAQEYSAVSPNTE